MKLASTKDDLFVFLGAAMIFSDIHISDRLEETKHQISDLQCFWNMYDVLVGDGSSFLCCELWCASWKSHYWMERKGQNQTLECCCCEKYLSIQPPWRCTLTKSKVVACELLSYMEDIVLQTINMVGWFLLSKVWNLKFCMVPNYGHWFTDFRTVFVFALGPFLPMKVIFFDFNGHLWDFWDLRFLFQV